MNPLLLKIVHAALFGVCLFCVVVLAVEMFPTERLDTTPAAAEEENALPDMPAPAFAAEPAARAVTEYAVVIERPLFMPDRRPYPPPAPITAPPAAATRQAASPLDFFLSAVIITPDKRIALVRSQRDGKTQKLLPGDEYEGWKLIGIEPDHISLRQGDEVRRLRLPSAGFASGGGSAQHHTGEQQ